MDKLKKIIKYDKKMMLALSILVIIGIISGSIFAIILDTSDKEIIVKSINQYYDNIIHGTYNYIDSMKNIFIPNIILIVLIWVIGISIIGVIIVIGIIFWKAYTLGFTISSFILTFKLKGLFLSILYLFPAIVLNMVVFMYLSTFSVQLSVITIKSILRRKSMNFNTFIHNYIKVLIISLTTIIISGLYELFINPYLLKVISSILLK